MPTVLRRALLCGLFVSSIASLGCDGRIDAPPAESAEVPDPPFVPAPAQMRRLTDTQYANVVNDVLGPVVVPSRIDPFDSIGGLQSVATSSRGYSPRGVEQYESAAFQIAEQAMTPSEARDAWMPCDPTGTVDDACARRVLVRVTRRAWRRPADGAEIETLVRIAAHAAETVGDFHGGLAYALSAVLQSPRTLFRTEFGASDAVVDGDAVRPLDGWELGERLAFFLWNTGPDEALLDAAAAGELDDLETLGPIVDGMLADDRARQGMRAFFSDMLALDGLDELGKDPAVFDHFGPDVGPSAREETLRVLEDVVFGRKDYRTIFTRRSTFINRRLASIYGVRAPSIDGFAPFTFPADSPRAGLLGHVSVLAGNSHFGSTSPTLRGLFVRRRILCGSVPAPPANVDTSIPEPSEEEEIITLRQRVQKHLQDPTCAGCHRLMDPLGLGLENFDALGGHRTIDNGEPIDASGSLNTQEFSNVIEMGQVLAESDEVPRCVARTAYRYAVGRNERVGEAASVNGGYRAFVGSGYQVLELLRSIALSDGFRSVGPPDETVPGAEVEE